MARYRVSINSWDIEVEANDFGDAMVEADSRFSFMSECEVELIYEEEE